MRAGLHAARQALGQEEGPGARSRRKPECASGRPSLARAPIASSSTSTRARSVRRRPGCGGGGGGGAARYPAIAAKRDLVQAAWIQSIRRLGWDSNGPSVAAPRWKRVRAVHVELIDHFAGLSLPRSVRNRGRPCTRKNLGLQVTWSARHERHCANVNPS